MWVVYGILKNYKKSRALMFVLWGTVHSTPPDLICMFMLVRWGQIVGWKNFDLITHAWRFAPMHFIIDIYTLKCWVHTSIIYFVQITKIIIMDDFYDDWWVCFGITFVVLFFLLNTIKNKMYVLTNLYTWGCFDTTFIQDEY